MKKMRLRRFHDETAETLWSCVREALIYFGGVPQHVLFDNAKTVDFSAEKTDADRLHKWLESLDPDDLGKYKM